MLINENVGKINFIPHAVFILSIYYKYYLDI